MGLAHTKGPFSYVVHFSPIFTLLTCSIPAISKHLQAEWKTADHDQMASLEASWSGSTVFQIRIIQVQQDKG